MDTIWHDEANRTAPLALWRYGHDYLRAARELCTRHRIRCIESQAPYHLAAQGVEFALLAFLRARGATMESLRREIAHSLTRALEQCEARGLPAMPPRLRAAVLELAACHGDGLFVHLPAADDAFPDIDPLVEAGVWVLDRAAPDVAAHYVAHLGGDESPSVDEFVRRMRADLCATADPLAAPALLGIRVTGTSGTAAPPA